MDKLILISDDNFDEVFELNPDNWVIVGLPDGRAAKISRDNLKAFLGTVQTIVPKAISIGDPAPVIPGIYRPTASGTYANLGGLEIDNDGKLNEVLYDGETFANVVTPLPPAENKIKDWLGGTYYETEQANHAGQIWKVVVPSTDQEPGFGADWEPVLDKVSQDKFGEVLPIVEMFTTGKNFLDKRTLVSGNYNNLTGEYNPNSMNWFATPVMPIPADIDNFILTGHGSGSTSSPRVLFWKEDLSFMQDDTILANGADISPVALAKGDGGNIPEDAFYWAFPLWNEADIGLTPTDNVVANRVMLREASTDSTYEPFNLIDPKYIKGGVASEEAINEAAGRIDSIEPFTTFLKEGYDQFYRFRGDSYYTLDNQITLINEGDFVEFTSRFDATSYSDGLGLLGHGTGLGTNVFGYYSENSIYLRENGSSTQPWLDFSGLGVSLAEFHKFKLVISGGNYRLYIDDQLFPTEHPVVNGLIISVIGGAYATFFKGAVKSVYIHKDPVEVGGDPIDLVIDDFTGANAVRVEQVYQKKDDPAEANPDFFYEVNPNGHSGRPKLTFYTKRKGSKKTYVGHDIVKFVNTAEIEYVDYYRNHGAYNYEFDGFTMRRLSTRALLSVENEFTLLMPGKVDHTGGVHGDETTLSVAFEVDGKEIDPMVETTLTPAKSILYHETSNLHNTADSPSSDPVIDPNHTVVAEHTKTVIFGNGGYRIVNAVKSKMEPFMPIRKMYSALFCIAKDQATFGYNELGEKLDLNWQGVQVTEELNKYTREFYGSNPDTELSCYAASRVVTPANLDGQREHFMQNRQSDSKYYSQFPQVDHDPGLPPIELDLDDVIIVEGVLEFTGGA